MHIKKIWINNYKVISNLELHFCPGINILIGDNGVGKTSILDAIVVALGGFFNGIDGVSAKNILQSDVRVDTVSLGSASVGLLYQSPVRIGCELDADDYYCVWERVREDEQANKKTKMVKHEGDITKYAKRLINSYEFMLPVFSYQSSLRASQTRRMDFGAELKKNIGDRRRGYLGCLDSVLDIKRIKQWCYEMQVIAFDQNRKVNEYEAFKYLVGSFMQKMNGSKEFPQVYYSRPHKDLVYLEDNKLVPISYLSSGYQSVLWMIMDIAYRICTLNPGVTDFENSKGIVLIDEVDMHLHPKWQWKVTSALQSTFPNIQFIIATHSPIVISSCKNANLVLIDDEQKATVLGDAYGYSVNDVLELCQGSTELLSEIKKLKEEFEESIAAMNYV